MKAHQFVATVYSSKQILVSSSGKMNKFKNIANKVVSRRCQSWVSYLEDVNPAAEVYSFPIFYYLNRPYSCLFHCSNLIKNIRK